MNDKRVIDMRALASGGWGAGGDGARGREWARPYQAPNPPESFYSLKTKNKQPQQQKVKN